MQGAFYPRLVRRRSPPSQPAGALRTAPTAKPHELPAMPFRVRSMFSLRERRLLFTLPAALLHLVYGLLCRERGVPFEPSSAPRTRFGIMCFPRRRAAPGLPLRTRETEPFGAGHGKRVPHTEIIRMGNPPYHGALFFTQVSFSRSPAGFYPRHRGRGPPHGRASE